MFSACGMYFFGQTMAETKSTERTQQPAFLLPAHGSPGGRNRQSFLPGHGPPKGTPAVSNRALGRDAGREPGRLAPWAGRAVAALVLLGLLVEGTPANGESRYITNR